MFKKNELVFALLILSAVFLGGYFLRNSSEETNVGKLIIGMTEDKTSGWMLTLAEEKGYFTQENIEIKRVEAGTNTISLLTSGEVDLTSQQISSGINAFLNNEDIKLIGIMEYGRDHYGVSRFREQEINNIKKVGVPRLGGAFHYNMIPILENMGVNPDEVEFVAAGANIISRITLLDRGDVDFILLAEEDLGKLSRDKYNILPPESILEKGDYITGVIATGDKLKNKKSEIQSYLNVIVRTRNYLLDEKNKEEMIALFKKELELSDDNALTYYETMIESRKGVSLIPDESVLDRITRAVAKVSSPQNPGRSLTDFVFKDLAKKAEKN